MKEEKIRIEQQEKYALGEKAYQKCLDKIAIHDQEIENELDKYRTANKGSAYSALDFLVHPDQASYSAKKYFQGWNQIQSRSYFYQWSKANRPGFSDQKGFWEIYFMDWMMKKYPEFCSEYNSELIDFFLKSHARPTYRF